MILLKLQGKPAKESFSEVVDECLGHSLCSFEICFTLCILCGYFPHSPTLEDSLQASTTKCRTFEVFCCPLAHNATHTQYSES